MLTLDEVKQYLRLDTDSEDEYLRILILLASEMCENYTRMPLPDELPESYKQAMLLCIGYFFEQRQGIVNFTTDGIKCGAYNYSTAEFCARIAGLLAGLSMTESATYQVLADVTAITESITADADIDAGKFILINDGEKIKVGRGVNSLATLSGDKTEDMKKIKIIEGMDLMRDDIRSAFESNYIGINNSYDNKVMFVAAINQYFDGLVRQGILYGEAENIADIDVAAQRDWLAQRYDVSEYSDDDIRKAKTKVF